jgi:hypothetical protein
MTLGQLLEQYAIRQPADLARLLGISPAYAWQLYHGRRQFTTAQALKLYDAKGIPIHELLRAQVTPTSAPRGRPRTRRRGEGPA